MSSDVQQHARYRPVCLRNKDNSMGLRSMEEKELELLCTSVNEESFGSALADCVLVRDSP